MTAWPYFFSRPPPPPPPMMFCQMCHITFNSWRLFLSKLVSCLAVKPLPVVKGQQAIRLRAVIDHTSPSGQRRVAGDEWQYPGPLTFKPTAEAVRQMISYIPIWFQEHGIHHPRGLPRTWQKMMQWPRRTPVLELKQNIVWNTHLLSCSQKPPRYGDIMFLKPNWSRY